MNLAGHTRGALSTVAVSKVSRPGLSSPLPYTHLSYIISWLLRKLGEPIPPPVSRSRRHEAADVSLPPLPSALVCCPGESPLACVLLPAAAPTSATLLTRRKRRRTGGVRRLWPLHVHLLPRVKPRPSVIATSPHDSWLAVVLLWWERSLTCGALRSVLCARRVAASVMEMSTSCRSRWDTGEEKMGLLSSSSLDTSVRGVAKASWSLNGRSAVQAHNTHTIHSSQTYGSGQSRQASGKATLSPGNAKPWHEHLAIGGYFLWHIESIFLSVLAPRRTLLSEFVVALGPWVVVAVLVFCGQWGGQAHGLCFDALHQRHHQRQQQLHRTSTHTSTHTAQKSDTDTDMREAGA